MKKLSLCVALLSGLISYSQVTPSKAQQSDSPREVEKCSEHHRMHDLKLKHPERFATAIHGKNDPKPTNSNATEKATVYTVPVVFHIIHTNGSENISDAQVADALAILNRDFRRQNSDANNVYSSFQGMPTDAEINFVFATVAPNGNCFPGITRTVSSTTNFGDDGQTQVDAVIAGNNVFQGIWPHNKYLNIYVCNDLGGAAGYTYLPNGGSTPSAEDMHYNGVFILHDYCGSIGTGNTFTSRALTHEVGHWLNLSHTWGDDNNPGVACGNDYVSDTPVTEGFTSCPNPNNARICNANIVENYENYMDYSYCSKMYTQGQVTRMRNAITSSIGGRSNIWTTANLNQVGGGTGTSLCALDFSANQSTLCAGGSITYSPSQTTGIATYSWSFPGGTPATSTAASPTVTYATAGTYNASLTVTGSSNGASYSKSKTGYVVVNSNTSVSLPISEGFVSSTFPPADWTIVNPNNNATWVRSNAVGVAPTAGNSLRFNNLSNNDSQNDEIRLPKADMASFSSAQLTFDVAYAPYNASRYDGLEVLVSTNCGGSFTSVYSKSNTTLATANATTSTFIPTATQWRNETVDLTPFVGFSSVWISFKNIAGNGNNLYIDNINVTGTAGTPPPSASYTLTGTTICAGESVTYTSTSTNSPTSYSWVFAGGTPATSTAATQVVTYASPGMYSSALTVTNAGGSNTSTNNPTITVDACLSVGENALAAISVYPNPSTGLVTISSESVNLHSVKVFNSMGQVVYEIKDLQTGKQELNLQNLAKGVYTLRILTDNGTQHVPVVLEK